MLLGHAVKGTFIGAAEDFKTYVAEMSYLRSDIKVDGPIIIKLS